MLFRSIMIFLLVLPVWIFYDGESAMLAAIGGLLLLLGGHLYQLGRMIRWIRAPLDAPVPEGRGTWELAFAGLHRRVRIRAGQQKALTTTLERFTSAAQALPDGIVILNRHRQIDWMNSRAEAHFQMSFATDRGQPITNLIRQPDFVDYLDAARFDEPLLYRGGRVEGQTLILQVIPYVEEQRLLISRDVTHLERLETMRRDFIANVSHELKTPLTVVAGFAEMLVDEDSRYSEAEIRHYLSLIGEQSARMRRLIEDLLSLSALETGSSAPGADRVELGPLLQSILSEAEALSAGRHRISLRNEGPATLLGCASELRSAFGNLASNAVRYTPAGGEVELIWRPRAGGAEYVVADTGIGIAGQHLPRLTERFYRVDRSRSRETGGTGLGLAIVKHVLTRHQATLEIESEPGKGSRFIARFPERRLAG